MTGKLRLIILAAAVAVVSGLGLLIILMEVRTPERRSVLRPHDGVATIAVMDFTQAFPLDPLPPGWFHRTFLTRAPGDFSFARKNGVPALRFATDDSASMLVRFTDIPVNSYPVLAWRWLVERPIDSALDERTTAGDDHPARIFLRFRSDAGQQRAMEIVWGNKRLRRGDFKYINGFPHYVARGAGAEIGRWYQERLDLRPLVEKFWPELESLRLAEVALFCDSDETDSASVAYFAELRMRRTASP